MRAGTRLPLVSYSQAHLRVKVERGRAAGFDCIACGGGAQEWAYQGGDLAEVTDDLGRTYSLTSRYYAPMCVTCHRRMDRAKADGRPITVCAGGHEWNEANTGRRRNGGRRWCRVCSRERTARWSAQQKAGRS